MPYEDRLKTLQYESPKKKLFTLEFDFLERSGGKKIGVNEFPDQSETNVQELGNIANRFPVECYITGQDYDREADRFWKALEESGVGTLDHPRWGSYDVVPITYKQREEFVNGMGRALFTIEFIRYYPDSVGFFALLNAPFEIAELIIEGIDRVLSIETALRRQGRNITAQVGTTLSEVNRIKGRTNGVLSAFKRENKNFGDRVQELSDRINEQQRKIERNIDDLAREPADLVIELNTLFALPSKIQSSIRAKIDGYTGILNSINDQFTQTGATFSGFEATIQSYTATALCISLAQCTLDGSLVTRNDAISSAESLYNASINLKGIYDRSETVYNGNVNYDIYRDTQKLLTVCSNLLIQRALNLPTERVEVLTQEISPIKFCYEKLNDITKVDFFIDYNKLQGNEILLMPVGKSVRYIP